MYVRHNDTQGVERDDEENRCHRVHIYLRLIGVGHSGRNNFPANVRHGRRLFKSRAIDVGHSAKSGASDRFVQDKSR
jgi:hypothetical protein